MMSFFRIIPVFLVALLSLGLTMVLSGCQSEKKIPGETTISPDGTKQTIEIEVIHGYQPNQIKAVPKLPIEILFKRNEDPSSCAKDLTFPGQNITVNLPNHETHTITLPAQEPGTRIPFQCTMDMMHGEIQVAKEASDA